jgi:hypothetical protein
MHIHPDKLARLRALAAAGLEPATVTNHSQINPLSLSGMLAADDLMGAHGQDRDNLHFWVDDEAPVTALTLGALTRRLHSNALRELHTGPLTAEPTFESAEANVDWLIGVMEGLPYRYSYTFHLPDNTFLPMEDGEDFHLGPDCRVVQSGDRLSQQFPVVLVPEPEVLGSETAFLQRLFFKTEPYSGTYIQFFDHGYAAPKLEGAVRSRALDKIKSFLGFAMATEFLTRRRRAPLSHAYSYYLHVLESGSWSFLEQAKVPASIGVQASTLAAGSHEMGSLGGRRRSHWAETFWEGVRVLYRPEVDARRIMAACQWFYEADAGDNALLTFVQMMVVLEILFGDEKPNDKIGLGELLRNRCAYAIGRGAADRAVIINRFKAIYDIRSQIVHRGKSRLSANERALFQDLRDYCRRAIVHEVRLVATDEGQRAAQATFGDVDIHIGDGIAGQAR